MIRNSVKFISWKERKTVCADLKNIYSSATVDLAKKELEKFKENVIPFFDFGPVPILEK